MALLTGWQPFGPLPNEMARWQRRMDRFQRRMDQLFGRWGLGVEGWPEVAVAYPPVNLWEDNDFVYAEAELPGLKLADLDMTVTGDNQLAIKGKRQPTAPEKVEWHRQERGFGTFERVLTLPVPVDPAKVDARFENGVLTIKMAKSEAAKPKKIPVKAE
jgi:HSP20 family protein